MNLPGPLAPLDHPASASGSVDVDESVPLQVAFEVEPGAQVYVSVSQGTIVKTFTQAGADPLVGWPAPSFRPTSPESAERLQRVTAADPSPRLPEIEINDELGL